MSLTAAELFCITQNLRSQNLKSIPTDAFFNGAIDIAASQGRDSNRREQKCL